MLLLGLQGSPRLKGNTSFLLSLFAQEAQALGAQSHIVHVDRKNILPCKEYIVCEKKGFCPIDDEMTHEIYPLLRKADVIIAATPIFFYNATAQLKALIDRSQTLWARKYKLKLRDPGYKTRKGFLLAVAATKGKTLFDGVKLTANYFFDAIDAEFEGSLTYRGIEAAGDIKKHPTVFQDVKTAANKLLKPLLDRKKLLFLCRDNTVLSQMASAFAQYLAGEKIEARSGGLQPAAKINPMMEKAMRERGIDMAFRKPQSLEEAMSAGHPETVITLGTGDSFPNIPDTDSQHWILPQLSENSLDDMRQLLDIIENRVTEGVCSFAESASTLNNRRK
jgi:multimeric flavodoxin WrbA/protein-tyrosine-phosphatase